MSFIKSVAKSSSLKLSSLKNYLLYLWQNRLIYKMLVSKDFKGRFKYTILGYFWHVLTPLTQIVIYLAIFSYIFGRDIPNYWVYLSTGLFAYNFFMACSVGSSKIIVENSRMITKMAMAREVLIFSKVTTGLITLSISYAILSILMLIFGVGISISILYLPIIVLLLMVFNTGVALLLSSITVYVRDVYNVISLIFNCFMFAFPIMYLAESRSSDFMELFWSICPLYYFLETIHDAFYWGIAPDSFQLIVCIVSSVAMLVIGLAIFKKLERGFAERL